jgi:hypothetical protein
MLDFAFPAVNLSQVLGAPGGHFAVLHLIRQQTLHDILAENPLWVIPQDPWAPAPCASERTSRLPVVYLPGRARVPRPAPALVFP